MMENSVFDIKKAEEIVDKYKNDPIKFMVDCLDVKKEYIWPKMVEMIESVKNNKMTSVKAGHSLSKSFTSARLVLWFLYCFYPATVITTAPTNVQVEEILWREIREAHANAKVPLGGIVTRTKIDLQGESGVKWFAYGFSTRPDNITQQATKFQGFHNKYILVVFDEAAGILSQIWQAKDALLTSGFCRFLAIGNPTNATGDFADTFKDSSFNKITISVLDSPNYKEGKEIIPGVSGREFEEIIAKKYGKESNFYKARVLGEIPNEDIDSIIQVKDVNASYEKFFIGERKKRYVACDPGDGGDRTVVYYMENTDIIDTLMFQKKNTMTTAGLVWVFMQKHKTKTYVGDCIGIGAGIADRIEEMSGHEGTVVRVNAAHGKPSGVPEMFLNRRAQMWIEGGEMFSMGDIELHEKDPELLEELTIPKQTVINGKLKVESKDELKKPGRLGRSTDKADAYLMGLYAYKHNLVLYDKDKDYKASANSHWEKTNYMTC